MLTLPADPGNTAPPSRLPLTPEGGYWAGKDGRAWRVSRPDRLLSRLSDRILVLDENHSLFYDAPAGKPSPAMARMSNFSLDSHGVVWANSIEWTAYGKNAYKAGSYLGLSPVVLFDPTTGGESDLGEVIDLHSVALVNDPNLLLPALNASRISQDQSMTTPATQTPAPQTPAPVKVDVAPVIDVTGPVTAAVNAAMAPVIEVLKALPAAMAAAVKPAEPAGAPALNSAQLHQVAQTQAFDALASQGKIAPSAESKATFMRATRTTEDLAATVADYGKMPALVNTPVAGLNSAQTASQQKPTVATPEQIALATKMGWDPKTLWPEAK